MKTLHKVLAAALGVMLLSGVLYVGPATAGVHTQYTTWGFDLGACEYECRMRYGLELFADEPENALHFGGYYGYATCIQKCNRDYWKSFDKDTDKLFD